MTVSHIAASRKGNHMGNTWKRKLLALLSVPLLAVPSAAGVYLWLEPHIGAIAAGMTAAGFESLYIGINILVITTPELRRYARNVALAGVATAVIFNTLARYQKMVGGNLRTAPFDGLALGLAVLESIPLAGLAYAVSVLLHRLSEADVRSRAESDEARALRDSLATAREQLTSLTSDLASKDTVLASATTDSAIARETVTKAENETRELREQLRMARATPATTRELPPTRTRIVAYTQGQLASSSRSLSDVARELGISEATLRGWIKVATNGHAVEIAEG
jgi:hypothetical protein